MKSDAQKISSDEKKKREKKRKGLKKFPVLANKFPANHPPPLPFFWMMVSEKKTDALGPVDKTPQNETSAQWNPCGYLLDDN